MWAGCTVWVDGIHATIVISIEETELEIHSDRNHEICFWP